MRVTLSRRPTWGEIPVRGALLMPLCALAVHQLRFYLVFGSHAPAVLARDGHGYLAFAEPAVVARLRGRSFSVTDLTAAPGALP